MRITVIILAALLLTACSTKNAVNPQLAADMPNKIIWAWERPEDLRFLDAKDFGVAFLAQTIFLEQDRVTPRPRHQPLAMSPGTYVIAVSRIETNKDGKKRPTFDAKMVTRTVSLIRNTLELPDVRAIQIDFDAVLSERGFYRDLMKELRATLLETPASATGQNAVALSEPPASAGGQNVEVRKNIPLTMTSLASWCTGDAWFNDFAVDEAVPMAFEMGADGDKIKAYLRNGNDWREPLCRGSYGISVDDPLGFDLKPNRRTYYFKNSPWVPADLPKLQ